MNQKMKIRMIIIVFIFIIALVFFLLKGNLFNRKKTILQSSENITIVPTMNDEIMADSSWCATFQLVWNDMKNEVVKQDIIFSPQEKMAENLNKEEFTEDMISDEYYFKMYGLKTLELKKQIEDGIMKKFHQKSEILDDFDWSESELNDPNNSSVDRYFFYSMLYREFHFLQKFDKLENGKFGDSYEDIEYFGIDRNSDSKLDNQIEVLYYHSVDDFAVIVNTKENDEVIFCKNPKGDHFNEIYHNMILKSESYHGDTSFDEKDEFKAPCLTFKIKREFNELEEKVFETENGVGSIAKAIQFIEFSLDEVGGKIKSEAGIDMMETTSLKPVEMEPRYFYVDDTFAIFIREKGKDVPYFAARIEDITKFQ
ncbi:MAG: hypothetical protein Q4D02_05955 [Clostridia bacterium]|nr:hypothetical protein [Clostridia bacterium]